MARSPHPDDVVGALAGFVHRLAPPPGENTVSDLPAYGHCTLAEWFPAPSRVPVVEVRRRWQAFGLESFDAWFPSQHRPIEATFRGVSHRHLPRYLLEFNYRLNRRGIADRLFFYLARRAMEGRPLPYHRLTAEGIG